MDVRGVLFRSCKCLYRLLPTLKAEYADVIWRADSLGEPRCRLAASLGTSLNNVTGRLHRGRKALRMRLEEMCRTCSTHGFLDCRCDEMPLGTDGPVVKTKPVRPSAKSRHARKGDA